MDFVCHDNYSKTSVVWILSVEARLSQAEQQRQIDLNRHDNFRTIASYEYVGSHPGGEKNTTARCFARYTLYLCT